MSGPPHLIRMPPHGRRLRKRQQAAGPFKEPERRLSIPWDAVFFVSLGLGFGLFALLTLWEHYS